MNLSFNMAGAIAPFPVKRSGADSAQTGSPSKSTPTHVALGAATSGSKASAANSAAASDSSGGSLTVQVLRAQLERLQKQLAQQERQLRAAVARDKDNDPANAPRIAALQSTVATTMGQIAETVARLAAALMAESGSSSGNLVSSAA